MREKFALFLAQRLEITTKGKTAGILMKEVKAKAISIQYAKEFQSLIRKLENYRKKYDTKNLMWNNRKFSLKEIGNDLKHNEDILTKTLHNILSNPDKSIRNEFEGLFYKQLSKSLLIARNEYIEIVNGFIKLFETYVKNCLEKGSHSFA